MTSPWTYGAFPGWHVSCWHHPGLTIDCLTLTFLHFTLVWLETLNSFNFFIRTRIYASFTSLESYQQELQLDPTFICIWRLWSRGKTGSILNHSSPLEAFGPPNVGFSYRVSENKFPSLFQYISIVLYLDLYLWVQLEDTQHFPITKSLSSCQELCPPVAHWDTQVEDLQWKVANPALRDLQSMKAHTIASFQHLRWNRSAYKLVDLGGKHFHQFYQVFWKDHI